jgi:chromatin remodeling complex protein RSC6
LDINLQRKRNPKKNLIIIIKEVNYAYFCTEEEPLDARQPDDKDEEPPDKDEEPPDDKDEEPPDDKVEDNNDSLSCLFIHDL